MREARSIKKGSLCLKGIILVFPFPLNNFLAKLYVSLLLFMSGSKGRLG